MDPFDKKNISEILALTPMQEGMLFHYLKEPDSESYFGQLSLTISGKIDIFVFQQAWVIVIQTNEMLRTVFRWEKLENPVQIILNEHQLQQYSYDLSVKIPGEKDHLEEIKIKDRENKFDLKEVPFRVTLCKIQEELYELIISNHHILYDGWSNGIILNEFFKAYNNLIHGNSLCKYKKGTFKEFVRWIRCRDEEKQETYWKEYLKDIDFSSELSIKKRNKHKTISPGRYKFSFETDTGARLIDFVKKSRRTLASMFYCAWGLLLQKYNNCDDVIFGTTVSGRNANVPGIEEMVGMFINTLPLRIRTRCGETLEELLYRVQSDLQAREEYENSSLVDVKQFSDMDSKQELFDSIVILENYPLAIMLDNWSKPQQEQPALSVESFSMREQTNYDLTVEITAFRNIEILMIYNESLYDSSSIEHLGGHFLNIVRQMMVDPGGKIAHLEIVSTTEREKILYDFNNTGIDFPETKTLGQLLEEQAGRTPHHIVLVGETIQMSYRELMEKARQLAFVLKEKGIFPDGVVGIIVEPSIEMIIGILGIISAGGAYLPVDPDFPLERIEYMLQDSRVNVLIAANTLAKEVKKLKKLEIKINLEIIYMESFDYSVLSSSQALNCSTSSSSSLAYIIYTSGSTGRPKGVMVEQRSLVNILAALQRSYPLMETDAYLLKTSCLFDVSLTELFGWFWTGGKLVIMEKNQRKDPIKIIEAIRRYRITHINFVPSLFAVFVECLELEKTQKSTGFTGLKYIFLAGEALAPGLVMRFRRLHAGIILENLYGPTEGTVYASGFSLSQWSGAGSVPIGKALANVKLYILNKYLRLQPIGAVGELCISGTGLARGYLNRPALTLEKFINYKLQITNTNIAAGKMDNKTFMQEVQGGITTRFYKKSPPGRRRQNIYKTGDLARWLPDGNVEFLGRSDYQIKIRGFRVELGEIESLLLNHEDIKEAVVNVWSGKNADDSYICAYLVAPEKIETGNVRQYVANELPDYMVPAYFIQIERMPLTGTGKINRKALPAPELKIRNTYVAPGTKLEEKLVEIWSAVLYGNTSEVKSPVNRPGIGIDDNFFELGGHSLKATRLISRIHKELNVVIPLQHIFKYPSVRTLAGFIDKAKPHVFTSLALAEKQEYYPLTPAQERLFVLQQMETDNIAYNMSRVLVLAGEPDYSRLEAALQQLIERHESLRTGFEIIEGKPGQRIHEAARFQIPFFQYDGNEDTGTFFAQVLETFVHPFDLSRPPLLRAGIVKSRETRNLFMIDMHHIISDGISTGILIRDFLAIYNGRELSPAVMHYSYKDFSQWQKSRTWKEAIKQQEQFWLKQLEGDLPVLHLPGDYPRPKVRSFTGHTLHFELTEEETGSLDSFAKNHEVTAFIILSAAFSILAAKLSGQEDIVTGTVSAGRGHADLENIIGMFVTTLALRSFPGAEKTVGTYLTEFKKTTFAAFENQDYPFEAIVDTLVKDRDAGRNPLFDVMLVLQNLDIPVMEAAGLKLVPQDYDSGISKFDLTFIGEKSEHNVLFSVEYCTALFKESTVQRYIQYYKILLNKILIHSGQKIIDLEILPEEEKRLLLYDFNNTGMDYPREKTIHQLFAEQVERTPDAVALMGYKDSQSISYTYYNYMTYRELNRQADWIALRMRKSSISAEPIIAILAKRSPEMMAGIMGILKSGAAYLPIDPDYPSERIDYMLEDSQAELLVIAGTSGKEVEKLNSLQLKRNPEIIFIDTPREFNSPSAPLLNVSTSHSPHHSSGLAYIIYTSGTTGKPKGVMINHGSLVNLCTWHNRYFRVKNTDHATQYAMMGFDASVWEIFPYLIIGASITIINPDIKLDIKKLNRFYETHDITIGFLPTQVCEQFMELENRSLRILLTGGDYLRTFIKRDYQLYNNYGPTENTVVNTSILINRQYANIPIGKPVHNNQVYILHPNTLRIQPIGIPGELWIGGEGLARGYLNKPGLTLERFILATRSRSHKDVYFSWCPGVPAAKLYKTGDLSRWLEDGTVEYIGRTDHQVKIRGFRIELGEIENRLLKHPNIKEAIVISRTGTDNDKHLCAYVIVKPPAAKNELMIMELREFLAAALPDYMIPAYFLQLEKLPLLPSGKVNRNALPEPVIKSSKKTLPQDDVQEKLVEIWAQILGQDHDKIGIDDNFFALGGHSLKAALVLSEIHTIFNVQMTLSQIFAGPTIRRLARHIKESGLDQYISIEPGEKKEYYVLSPAQKRLYIVQKTDRDDTAYNLPAGMLLAGNPDKERLENTFNQLVQRHESFRTSFKMVQGEPVQVVHDEVKFVIEYDELSATEVNRQSPPMNKEEGVPQAERIFNHFIGPFDLSAAPLLRVGLAGLEPEKYLLMMDMHHIISDGRSMSIFINDFMAQYAAANEKLPPLRLQYRDFCGWQARTIGNRTGKETGKEIEKEKPEPWETYWWEQFQEPVPVPELPYDFPRPVKRCSAGSNLEFTICQTATRDLKQLAADENVTLFMVLMALYNILLSKLSWREDIVVGTPAVGRENKELRHIIGMFVNTLAIRSFPCGEKTFSHFLNEVKNQILDAFEHQAYPFENLVEKVATHRDSSRNPLFDTFFTLQTIDMPEATIPGLTLTPFEYKSRSSRVDMTWIGIEKDNRLRFNIEYSTALFKEETIEGFGDYFNRIIAAVLEDRNIFIKNIEVSTGFTDMEENTYEKEAEGDFGF